MITSMINFRYGTYSGYAGSNINPDTLYFLTDVGKIFKGTIDVTQNFQSVSKEVYDNLTVSNTIPYTYYVCRENYKIKIQTVLDGVGSLHEIYPGFITANGESVSAEKVLTTQSYVRQEIDAAINSILGNLENPIDVLTGANKVVVTDGQGSIANSGYTIGDGEISESAQDASDKILATEKAAKKAAEDAESSWASF